MDGGLDPRTIKSCEKVNKILLKGYKNKEQAWRNKMRYRAALNGGHVLARNVLPHDDDVCVPRLALTPELGPHARHGLQLYGHRHARHPGRRDSA